MVILCITHYTLFSVEYNIVYITQYILSINVLALDDATRRLSPMIPCHVVCLQSRALQLYTRLCALKYLLYIIHCFPIVYTLSIPIF